MVFLVPTQEILNQWVWQDAWAKNLHLEQARNSDAVGPKTTPSEVPFVPQRHLG